MQRTPEITQILNPKTGISGPSSIPSVGAYPRAPGETGSVVVEGYWEDDSSPHDLQNFQNLTELIDRVMVHGMDGENTVNSLDKPMKGSDSTKFHEDADN